MHLNVEDYSPELIANLSALISGRRLPHAIIIDGGLDAKRQNLANYLAASMVCTGDSERPCNNCLGCKKAWNGIHPDIITVAPEDHKKTLSVDSIRAMQRDAYVLPNEAQRKVYIIAQADLMQPYAQNALLKILEEPPAFVSFLLLCQTHTVLLPTVLSRSAVFCIGPAGSEGLSEKKQNQVRELSQRIALAAANKNEPELLRCTGEFEKNAELLEACVLNLESVFRDALIYSHKNENIIITDTISAKELAGKLSAEQLINLTQAVRDIKLSIDLHANNNLTITRLCSTLISVVEG